MFVLLKFKCVFEEFFCCVTCGTEQGLFQTLHATADSALLLIPTRYEESVTITGRILLSLIRHDLNNGSGHLIKD